MNKSLVRQSSHDPSLRVLDSFYERNLIPAEKKPFLIDLQRSAGPVMAVEDGGYILDVASQIASLGLGFNPSPMFGAAQLLESWTGRTDTDVAHQVRAAFERLLQQKLAWPEMSLQLCQSGAEANELALGGSYASRVHADARKILAFKNSFHGRMMVALSATWNPAKREPFAFPGYDVAYVEYPALPDDDILGPAEPSDWAAGWAQATRADFSETLACWRQASDNDGLLRAELDVLESVRQQLVSQEFFAILIEPMQCEGGDRYSSARFHVGLVNLASAFSVALIYDEIQTGFGLGGDFFWHKKFDLHDAVGDTLYPDYVVMAKKAQVGAVASHRPLPFQEQFNMTSLARGFIHASMIDQFQAEIFQMEAENRKRLSQLLAKYPDKLCRPRVSGISFAFDFCDESDLKRFIGLRFDFGLLYYPAGQSSARFRFSLAFRGDWIDQSWQAIDAALQATFLGEIASDRPAQVLEVDDVQANYDFHQQFLQGKLDRLLAKQRDSHEEENAVVSIESFLRHALDAEAIPHDELELVMLDRSNYPDYREAIWQMQLKVYEPLRQTPMEKFDQLIAAINHLAFLLTCQGEVVAMAFAAPPANFPGERGVREDRYFDDPQTVYMLDLTVAPQHRGKLGRIMKQTLCLLAQKRGLSAVQGRNRDRLARGMWAINLSLGAINTRVLENDYLDDEDFRDCLVYRCGLDWKPTPIHLSDGPAFPLHESDLDKTFLQEQLPALTNKLTLSNFVTRPFLEQLSDVFDLVPEPIRHGYSCSGISECVDKLTKSIWLQRQPRVTLLTINGHFFGSGSFLARSLSGVGEPFFPVKCLPRPELDLLRFEDQLRQQLETDEILAMFVEPLGWETCQKLSLQTLALIRRICTETGTPLVYHESAGAAFRYDQRAFLPSGLPELTPDAGMLYLGGQMAICYLGTEWFVDTPLTMISTWDGDAFSLAQFHRVMTTITADTDRYFQTMQRYQAVLEQQLKQNQLSEYSLQHGIGRFRGSLEVELRKMFQQDEDGWFLSCPSYGQMRALIERWSK